MGLHITSAAPYFISFALKHIYNTLKLNTIQNTSTHLTLHFFIIHNHHIYIFVIFVNYSFKYNQQL